MRQKITGVMATTGVSLLVLATAGKISGAQWLMIDSVFQTFAANIAVHAGFALIKKFAGKHPAAEAALGIVFTFAVLMLFGALFGWFGNGTPPAVLAVISVTVYAAGWLMDLFRAKEDANAINRLLKSKRRLL